MKYYIIAGEASGDLHGANLIRQLLKKDPDAKLRYWGGDMMAEAVGEFPGTDAVQVRHIRELAFMGFWEVVSHLSAVVGNIRLCKHDIKAFAPDVVVFIDYPGFNMKIAKYTHTLGLKNVHYISPQVWAWKSGRIKQMRRDLDRLCYILPMEQEYYADKDFPQAVYVGHPLLDEVKRYSRKQGCLRTSPDRQVVALLPGSRKHELERLLPTMMQLAANHQEYHFVLAGMSLVGEEYYRRYIPADAKNVEIVFDLTYDVLSMSIAAVVCSGTATLETALFRVPEVVCYQCSKLSAAIVKHYISSRIKYISLVNLIADAPVVTELIQEDYNIERLESEFAKITVDEEARSKMLSEYDRVIGILGGEGASERTAEEIVRCMM